MQRSPYAALALLVGLTIAQVIATLHVSSSNGELHRHLVLIKDAGYLPIPNPNIMARLHDFGPAFWGGLFFTLTTGAGLSILSLCAAWAWSRVLRENRLPLIGFLAVWAAAVTGVNLRGFCPMVSLYFLLIPPAVFWAALRGLAVRSGPRIRGIAIVYLLPIFLLGGGFWVFGMDSHLFTDVRDHVLLSNRLGTKINDFYYTYTLYPAEVLKPLQQKLLKTANLEGVPRGPAAKALEKTLLDSDYCPVGGAEAVDLKIEQNGNDLFLKHRGRTALKTTVQEFLAGPASLLKEFSRKVDRHASFRQFTFFSLLIGLPLAFYLVLHAFFYLFSRPFLNPKGSMVLASVLCLVLGAAFLGFLQYGRALNMGAGGLEEALRGTNWHRRVAALRVVEQKGLEVGEFQAYPQLLRSPHVPERYWLVRALGVSRRPETYRDLLVFLDDPHPNVVSMAFRSLEERGDRRAVRTILQRIETSAHWYSQWYAYRALRGLGWKQGASN